MKTNRYSQIIEKIFFAHRQPGERILSFARDEIVQVAADLDIKLPKNVGDVIYSFRFREELPESIRTTAPEGLAWVIKLAGKAQYKFVAEPPWVIQPNPGLIRVKIPDSTPGIISKLHLISMIVAIAAFIVGCDGSSFDSNAARARADAANVARVSLGLRRIGSTWTCYRSNHGLDEWSIFQSAAAGDKAVKYDSEGELVYEEDMYLSGRTFHMDDQTAEELLSIYYNYTTKKAELHYHGTDAVTRRLVEGTLTASAPDVLSVADRILKTWGILRL